jgi:protein involved in polysaccharide export with SLBB domain
VKREIAVDAERVRSRLQNGDFRVGDRIDISVRGEPNFPVTVTVEPGPMIVLDLFGDISLAGVLRSEIEEHLTEALGRFIRDPFVRATAQMRISVLGAVGNPGFYTVPAETLLGDVLMLAGGPGTPDLDDLRIERAGQSLYEQAQVQEALREGLTLDQLNLQAGDQIVLPIPSTGNFFLGTLMPVLGALGSLSFLIFQVF